MAESPRGVQSTEIAEAIAARMPKCPICSGRNVRLAGRRGAMENFIALAGLKAFRCRACQHRFFKLRFYEDEPATERNSKE